MVGMVSSFPQEERRENKRNITRPDQPSHKKGGTKFGLMLNVVLAILLVGAGFMLVRAEQERRNTREALMTKEQEIEEVRRLTQQQGAEVAGEVLTNVRKHIRIPEVPEPTVATIINIDELRGTSEFYDGAKNGDHLIITENRAILYDPDEGIIIDVVPVQITPEDAAPEEEWEAPVVEEAPEL